MSFCAFPSFLVYNQTNVINRTKNIRRFAAGLLMNRLVQINRGLNVNPNIIAGGLFDYSILKI
jgi:hypothetical protein